MIGRPSVVHFAGVTQWTYTGKQLNGVRLIQIHPTRGQGGRDQGRRRGHRGKPARRGHGHRLLWEGIREDTMFVPSTFGPMQKMAKSLARPITNQPIFSSDDRYYDNLSGQQAYKCFACRVRKA